MLSNEMQFCVTFLSLFHFFATSLYFILPTSLIRLVPLPVFISISIFLFLFFSLSCPPSVSLDRYLFLSPLYTLLLPLTGFLYQLSFSSLYSPLFILSYYTYKILDTYRNTLCRTELQVNQNASLQTT